MVRGKNKNTIAKPFITQEIAEVYDHLFLSMTLPMFLGKKLMQFLIIKIIRIQQQVEEFLFANCKIVPLFSNITLHLRMNPSVSLQVSL